MSHLQKIPIKQALSQAKKAAKRGNATLALELYQTVLQHQPNHPIAQRGVRKLQKEIPNTLSAAEQQQNPPQDQLNALINLFHQGQMPEAEHFCRQLLHNHPQSLVVNNILGVVLKELGRLEEAVDAYDKVIQLKPDYAVAYSNRGVALQESGKLKEAMASCDRAIQINPNYAEAYCNRGVTLQALERHQDAVQAFDKAIQLKPEYAEAYCNRGVALQELGQVEEAMQAYDDTIRFNPGYAVAYSNRGVTLQALGRLEESVQAFDKAIQIKPDYAEAYCNRGITLRELEQPEEAAKALNKAIQLNPDYAEAFFNLGVTLQALARHQDAVQAFDKAIHLKPEYAEAYCNRGVALQELGQVEEALLWWHKATQIKPDYAKAYFNRGKVQQMLGRAEEATVSYNKAIQLSPNYVPAHRGLSNLKNYQANDPQLELMEGLFAQSVPGEKDRVHLCFALAKAYEGLGEYDKSFNFLEEGNRIRYKELNYDLADVKSAVTKIKEIFSAENMALEVAADEIALIHPLFIVGMPRSGTTLVEQILASHTRVFGAGELETMGILVDPILSSLPEPKISRHISNISRNQIKTVREGYLVALAALNVQEKIITDKMPLNFLFIGFILSAFPDAKIIHVNRDPRATCWSIYKHYFSSDGNGYAYDLGILAEFYNLYTDLLSFWRERFPDDIYDLSYENLTENQEAETRKLLQFCELEWEEQCLDFHETKRVVKTASNAQVRKKMYKGSSETWRKYERHLQPLLKDLGYKI